MIRFPAKHNLIPGRSPFVDTRLDDWLSAPSVYALLQETCALHGEKTALTWIGSAEPGETARQVSYAEFLAEVTRSANLFRSLGVQRTDVVAFMLPALVETQYVLWGAEAAGIACPVNFLLQAEHIAQLLLAAGARVLVACGPAPGCPAPGSDTWEKALQVRRLIPGLVLVLVKAGADEAEKADEADHAGAIDFDSARRAQPALPAFSDRPARHDVAAYFHTGGTTGLPKLVVHTHENQLAAAYGGAACANLTVADVITNGLPMFHVAGTIFSSLSQLMAGAGILVLSAAGFRNPAMVSGFWRIVERYRVTILCAVPTALAAVLAHDRGDADISSLRLVMSGAAPLPRSVAERAERVTGREVRELLGMTETGGVLATEAPWHERVLGSTGHPIPFVDMEARRMSGDAGLGERCGPGEAGVFVIRGPIVTAGYLNALHNVGAYTHDGWLVSGDLGYLDATGRVFITGRAKDLIIRGGHNIDPAMIEAAFLANPAVGAAAAVGMPDAHAGELPVVFIVLAPGHAASQGSLQSFAEERIHERPAFPKRVFIVDSLPMTAVGKVFKPALRNRCAETLFAEALLGEPVRSLSASEDAQRGKLLRIGLDVTAGQRVAVQRRITEKLAGFLVTVCWDE